MMRQRYFVDNTNLSLAIVFMKTFWDLFINSSHKELTTLQHTDLISLQRKESRLNTQTLLHSYWLYTFILKKYNLICSFTMVLEIMKRMITKLCQLYGVRHYLCTVRMLVWFNQPLLKLSNCAIHLQQREQLLRISCKKKALFTFTATDITLFIYLFHPCQNLQSGPLHWHIQYKNTVLYAFSKTHNKENNIVAVSYRVLAFAKASIHDPVAAMALGRPLTN
jgi:hypothetical protein